MTDSEPERFGLPSSNDLKFSAQILHPLIDSLASLFFPATCALCQNIVESVSSGVICQACWQKVRRFEGVVCARCGYGFPSRNIELAVPLCGGCRRGFFLFDFARAYSQFEDPFKEIIHQFKYRSHRSLARPLSELLFSAYQSHWEDCSSDLIVPVPLHKSRERARGFNQAFELSKPLGKLAHIPVRSNLLLRVRPTKVQAGLSRRERRLNVTGAFELSRDGTVEDQAVLLVDDVFTTGATLNECAKILRRNGARRVNVLTLARVVR
jgi:ComF family protein